MASASDTGFNPEECYSVVRRTHKRNSLEAVSRDYDVYFTDIEGNAHHLKEIFQSLFNKLVTEIETDLPDFSHRIRLVLNAPSLNYPMHIPFHPACDFNIDLILNEIERVLNSNENFDISDSVKVNILSVSSPVMGGYELGGIQNRTVPDICSFAKQKMSITTIRDTNDSNDCLLRALAVGVALVERKDSGRYKHLSRVESQTAEKKQLLYRLKRFDGFDCESGSTNRCTMEDSTILASSSFLKQYMITLFDRNFMGVFIKVLTTGRINILISCMTVQITMLTSSVPLKDFLWLGITVTFAKKVVRISNTCVQEVVVCFVVSQNARIVLVILRALNNQVGQQSLSVILAVLSSGHKTVWTTILKPDFVLCISNAHRVPVQYHVTPLQISAAQRNGALFVRNTLTTPLKRFMNASCKGPNLT